MDWTKATANPQIIIIIDSQLLMQFMAKKGNTMTNDPMSCLSTHLMTQIKECYDKVAAQSQAIAELLLEGQLNDWQDFDLKEVQL